MATWGDVQDAEPEFAARVQARFESGRHKTLATTRADGSPRISGLECEFTDGQLTFGSMAGARKGADLRRDPRFALHSAPDVEMVDGDAKVGGRAVPVTDGAATARFVEGLPLELPPSGMALFRAELTDASLARVEGDVMVIDVWQPGQAPRQVRRQ